MNPKVLVLIAILALWVFMLSQLLHQTRQKLIETREWVIKIQKQLATPPPQAPGPRSQR